MIYLLIFICILLVLFILPLKINIYYEFTDISKYKVTISYLFGLVNKEIDSTKKEIKQNKKGFSKFEKIDAYEFMKYFIDKGKIKKINLDVDIGLNDPFILGTIVGLIWTIIGIVLGYIFHNKRIDEVKERNIMVQPYFNQEIFQIFFSCIIKVNLVYIITVYIRILKKRKGGDIFARASNRRFNENYNG